MNVLFHQSFILYLKRNIKNKGKKSGKKIHSAQITLLLLFKLNRVLVTKIKTFTILCRKWKLMWFSQPGTILIYPFLKVTDLRHFEKSMRWRCFLSGLSYSVGQVHEVFWWVVLRHTVKPLRNSLTNSHIEWKEGSLSVNAFLK